VKDELEDLFRSYPRAAQAEALYGTVTRMLGILELFFGGYIMVESEEANRLYLLLRRGAETLAADFPEVKDALNELISLFPNLYEAIGHPDSPDEKWEFDASPVVGTLKARLSEAVLEASTVPAAGARQAIQASFEQIDKRIDAYRKVRRRENAEFLGKVKQSAERAKPFLESIRAEEAPLEYDVAISFAGTERDAAEALATIVRDAGGSVFYDAFYPEQLWGKDLTVFFDDIYRKKSRYAVVFVSAEYANRKWPVQELRSALARAVEEKGREYILPIKVDDTELPGMPPTLGYLSLAEYGIDRIADILLKKLGLEGARQPPKRSDAAADVSHDVVQQDSHDTPASLEEVLASLKPRERRVFSLMQGIDCDFPHTLRQAAEELGLSWEVTHNTYVMALRKLRHPSRSRKLFALAALPLEARPEGLLEIISALMAENPPAL